MGALAIACSVCFGDPSSLQAQGTKMGVLFLLAVVVVVLGGIGWTAASWARRARELDRSS